MSTSKKVISYKNLPARFPVLLSLVAWLMLDRLDPAGWVQGVVWTVIGILWIASFIGAYTQDLVDVFNGK